VSWNDAQQYARWLSSITKKKYRLPTEAEWEYAARAGASTRFWWGNQFIPGMANCKDCGDGSDPHQPMKVASFAPNSFGLYDMTGGVAQWVSDCWHKDYHGAPKDGSSWEAPNCRERVLRGGSWRNDSSYARAASRSRYDPGVRYLAHGLRIARSEE
jgi:formylglycine-generating enzyme required for sulfatase activity